MLTEEEKSFMVYWEQNRNRKKNLIWQLAAGLPMALLVAGGTFLAYFSDWYKRAVMVINWSASGVLVVLIGLIGIVVFIVVFSARHKWDLNEQRYRELLIKQEKEKLLQRK
ncbi:MAG: hypothetical protein U0U70_04825 [Chitinophagaceae bacterium]